jgi:hypothetical protein
VSSQPTLNLADFNQGGLCGSAYINQTFLEHIRRHFRGNHDFIEECTGLRFGEFEAVSLRAFEKKKRTFNGFSADQRDTVITVPGLRPLPALGIQQGRYIVSKYEAPFPIQLDIMADIFV